MYANFNHYLDTFCEVRGDKYRYSGFFQGWFAHSSLIFSKVLNLIITTNIQNKFQFHDLFFSWTLLWKKVNQKGILAILLWCDHTACTLAHVCRSKHIVRINKEISYNSHSVIILHAPNRENVLLLASPDSCNQIDLFLKQVCARSV